MDCHYLSPLIMVLSLSLMYFQNLCSRIKFSKDLLLHFNHKLNGRLRGRIDPLWKGWEFRRVRNRTGRRYWKRIRWCNDQHHIQFLESAYRSWCSEGRFEPKYRKCVTFTLTILEFATEIQRYSDMKRGGNESDISPGDKVLVWQLQNRDKITPTFRSEPLIVKAKCGNSFTLDADGVEYKQNITHVKKFLGGQHDDPQNSSQMMWNPNQLQMMTKCSRVIPRNL